jgi:translocation and assembly module TamB
LLGGRVEGATLALNGRFAPGGLVLNPGCAPLTFRSLSVSGLDLAAASLRLCPAGRALVANGRVAGIVQAPRLRGTLGSSPITLAASRARFDGSDFRITDLVARLGSADRASRLDVAQLSGSPGNGVGGRFTGASGQIGKVPLIVSEGSGRWRLAGGLLTVSGAITVSDEPDPARFDPLVARDFALRIRDQDIVATATLREPESGIEVAEVALRHDLGSGVGNADLEVDGISFAPDGLQPEEITRLTLGVIANVDGSLKGQGRIAWSPEAVTSTGRFRVEAASLAAPFGPVTGVATDIRFTDLLGLETAPGQTLTVATVNPGILVEDGVVTYRLDPGLKVAIERARWPFAGGETGTFDGTLPMIFDRDGGRIVGGTLVSRTPGGTLSYIGQVSNADLGIWGGIAFDALKSIAYQRMTIDLTGEIDGEMVSQIRFAGVSRGTIQPVATGLIARIGGQLATELQRLPFIFNIQIRAPFRGLIAMTRSFDDPSLLIQDQLGPQFEAVQPSSSEDKR